MNTRIQAILLVVFLLGSILITQIPSYSASKQNHNLPSPPTSLSQGIPPSLIYQNASMLEQAQSYVRTPSRKWNVLDPKIEAEAIFVQSLDDSTSFFRLNTYKPWPMASLSKLLTAVVALEEFGPNKKISISNAAVKTEGEAGDLKSGEVYSTQDLIKILLLTSSNDAATALAEHAGDLDVFSRMLNRKAGSLGMEKTILHDASGLSDLNESTAVDLVKLIRYVLEKHPDLFAWTRISSALVQPLNDTVTKETRSIIPFVGEANFLGGKTGTSPEAKENFAGVFSFHNRRIAVIILGSTNRVKAVHDILKWIEEAYDIND